MTFVNSKRVVLLFSGFASTGYLSYVLICIAMILAGFISIGLKVLRLKVEIRIVQRQWKRRKALVRGLLALLSVVWDFGLMLCIMSYNCGVFLSACAGITLGVAILGDQLYEAHTCQCKNNGKSPALTAVTEDRTAYGEYTADNSSANAERPPPSSIFNDPLNCCHDL